MGYQTKLMEADDIANAFNASADHSYWRASIGGGRNTPEINFNSRSSMVTVTYRLASKDFTVAFSKSACAFGDYLASAYRSLEQIMARLVSAGCPFTMPAEESAVLRIEYNPGRKVAIAHLAHCGEAWLDAEPMPFKVPERKIEENNSEGVDGV